MTEAQYYKNYWKAITGSTKATREIMALLQPVYIEAGKFAANEVRKATMAGASSITIDSWTSIEQQLEIGADNIRENLNKYLQEGVFLKSKNVSSIDEKYLIDIIDQNKIFISKTGIANIFTAVNNNVVANMVARIYGDGYSYSDRIWRAGVDYQNQIKRVITSGLSAGRDVIDIAADINVYVKDGRRGLIKRWGNLIEGNRDFMRRIRKDVDYNSLRIVRTELYTSLRSVSVQNGIANPGATGLYNWIRQTTEYFGCTCPDNEAGSPYKAEDVPSSHPNCLCIVQPVLRDRKKFVNDLKRWTEGESVGYLDEWNNNIYQYVPK